MGKNEKKAEAALQEGGVKPQESSKKPANTSIFEKWMRGVGLLTLIERLARSGIWQLIGNAIKWSWGRLVSIFL